MASPTNPPPRQQSAAAFWKTYFGKFRRRVGDREVSQTGPAPLTGAADPSAAGERAEPVLPFPDRRRKRLQRHRLLR